MTDLASRAPAGLAFAAGDLFPDLELPSVGTGARARISDWRGHEVLVHLFASW